MKKLTTNEFIDKCIITYGNKYDYSKVVYINNKTKVCIICPEHGEFFIRPNDFLTGYSCPECGGTKKMTTKEFIEKAKIVHNNFFSYEKTNYKNSNEKVIVTCPIHGDFEVKANNHLNGYNCKQCQIEGINHEITKLKQKNKSTKTYNTKEFIEKAKEVHGNRYDFSKTKYINARTKVCVTCKIHGDFMITPGHFLGGKGCNKCSKNYRYNNEEIIELFKTIHNDNYDYSNVNYKNTHTNVEIICHVHGPFEQSPANHLKGQGCPKCIQSKLENNLMQFLKDNKISFEQQKTFDWLKYNRNLYLDFYLPEYNIAIECQGIQHFEPISFGEKDKKIVDKMFEDIQIRDNIKKDLCKKNGIVLYYFNYNDNISKFNFLT